MANDLKNAGLDVIILPARNYITLDGDIKLATFPILSTVDSGLIIKCKNNVIVNLNDTFQDKDKEYEKRVRDIQLQRETAFQNLLHKVLKQP